MFSCVTLAQRVHQDHPLREIRKLTDSPFQPRSENHPVRRVCDQPQPPLADREDRRVVEADRPARPGEAARTRQGRLAPRLQLRGPQAAPVAKAYSKPRPPAAVRLKPGSVFKPATRNYLQAPNANSSVQKLNRQNFIRKRRTLRLFQQAPGVSLATKRRSRFMPTAST